MSALVRSYPDAFQSMGGATTIKDTISCSESTTEQIKLKFSHQIYVQPVDWHPRITLPNGYTPTEVVLQTLEVFPLSNPNVCFNLNSKYSIEGILPRSFFGIICQCSVTHTFVFSLSNQMSPFFNELSGLRQVNKIWM
jgi:hypothetical protein